MDLNKLISSYVKLRERLAEKKAEYENSVAPLKETMDKIEVALLEHFNETGSESARTDAGTAYRSIKSTASVADRDAYFDWVMKNPEERLCFIEARCSKKAVDEYIEENGGELPPGINYTQVMQVNVRRSS